MTPKEFEAAVESLLRLSGFSVKGETLLGHKKIDLYAEERTVARTRRVAVECKRYGRRLDHGDVVGIHTDYRALYDAGVIDDVLLVTIEGLTPSAQTYLDLARGIAHIQFSDLENAVIDFSSYLTGLVRQVHDDGLSSYYIRPQVDDGRDLQELVEDWIGNGTEPLAILGGYGMGKTSFARYMAAVLAERAIADPVARRPIVIKLSDIGAEQTLEGLFGRIFSTSAQVPRYNFDAFMALNKRGRFVIFLDGFDEMRHALTRDQLRYNFGELHRLIVPNSRVVVLGRPTAFLDDLEHQTILHGLRVTHDHQWRDPHWPDYREVTLQPFTPAQIDRFLAGYAEHLSRSGAINAAEAGEIRQSISELPPNVADLATRPVQLRILCEVLPQWKGDAKDLTVAVLYSAFIDLVIEREQGKLARHRFNKDERRHFAMRLAYWMWTNQSAQSLPAARIPHELFPSPRDGETSEAIRRDMLAACFLERKLGNILYFPHRSFQEFLVAETLLEDIRNGRATARTLSDTVTPEIGEFLADLANNADFTQFVAALRRANGAVSWTLLRSWLARPVFATMALSLLVVPEILGPWTLILATAAVLTGTAGETATEFVVRLRDLLPLLSRQGKLVALFCAMTLLSQTRDHAVAVPLVELIQAFASIIYNDFVDTERSESAKKEQRRNPAEVMAESVVPETRVLRAVSYLPAPDGQIAVDLMRAFTIVGREIDASVTEWRDVKEAGLTGEPPPLSFQIPATASTVPPSESTFLQAFTTYLRSRRASTAP